MTGKYWTVFGDDKREVVTYSPYKLNEIIGIVFLWTKIEEVLKRTMSEKRLAGKEKTIDYQTLLAKWHFLWAYSEVINRLYFGDKNSVWKRLIDGKNLDSKDNFIEVWFRRIYKIIAEVIEDNYHRNKLDKQLDQEEDIQSFNLKNWLRSQSAFDILKTRFKRIEKEDYPF